MVKEVPRVAISEPDSRPQSPITIQITVPVEAYQSLEDGQEISVSLRKGWRHSVACFSGRSISVLPQGPSHRPTHAPPHAPPHVPPPSPPHAPSRLYRTNQGRNGLAPSYSGHLSRSPSREELHAQFDSISEAYHEAGRARAKSAGNRSKAAAEAQSARGFRLAEYNHYDDLLHAMPGHPCLLYPLPKGTITPQHPQYAARGADKRFFVITKGLAVGAFYGRWDVIRKLVDGVPGAVYKKVNSFAESKAKFDSMYPEGIEIISPIGTTFY
ncbi:hypothetical protein BV22DRAFT_1135041 [Leucogyrophana mollusca]|uniref:Uncharacterized protein n=1 Tax=Leucogyrophana mollusca TaxID=85980 RepID=A0ACB8AX64_9AGAM|nr:hypothetical protein BV22DRAFT_1135041 [Leucogyrophana mollusca]